MKWFSGRTIGVEYSLQTIHGTSSINPHHPQLKAIWQPQMIKALVLPHSKNQGKLWRSPDPSVTCLRSGSPGDTRTGAW